MNENILAETAKRLTNAPRGIIAADESSNTCNTRFEKLGIATTEENRRTYRELLITTPGIEQYVSGFILYDETIRQKNIEGKNFTDILKEKGLDIGIKVDAGLKDLPEHPGEKFTDGLDGLDERLKEYKNMGATFAKWRAVYSISDITPSELCMKVNAEILTKYALLCQANDIVPIIEPEVLFEGEHTLERCYEVTKRNLEILFAELGDKKVFLPGLILKTSMVLPGKDAKVGVKNIDIAQMTVKCLKERVPPEIGGIVFLSGGQSEENSTVNLNLAHQKMGPLPWNLTFSYSRAIQNPVLKYWAENPTDISGAQKLLLIAAKNNSLASVGKYEG